LSSIVIFNARRTYASVVLGIVILSVRASVCHTGALRQNQTMHCGYFDTTRKNNHSSFLTLTAVGGRRPFCLKFCVQSDPPHSKKRRLRQISAYNVSTVRDSEKVQKMINRKSITSFQVSYIWSAYATPKSPKGWLKKRLVCFLKIKFNFRQIKYAIKFLCVITSSGKVAVEPFLHLTVIDTGTKRNPST